MAERHSPRFQIDGTRLCWRRGNESVWIEPYGPDVIRVRSTVLPKMPEADFALLAAEPAKATIEVGEKFATVHNGRLTATVTTDGSVKFTAPGGRELLADVHRPHRGPRYFHHHRGDLFRVDAHFKAYDGEKIFGLGQRRSSRLDHKGCVLDLEHYNTHISIPFYLSNRGYGFLWNNPGIGRVELGHTMTRWAMDATTHVDYLVFAGEGPADILARYADATGHTPMLPEWAAGYWQSKLRYQTQAELLAVAREHKLVRKLPLDVIVCDYFHWTAMGDWKFDPAAWPDPAAMVAELKAMGVRLMVSVWPTVNPDSENFKALEERGLLVRPEAGPQAQRPFVDTKGDWTVFVSFYDATHPEARQFLWKEIREHYVKLGIKLFWLDCNEPEIFPIQFDNCRFYAGNGEQVAGLYPLEHCRAFYDGLVGDGEHEVVTLARSTWAGGQRYGSIIWSGDIASTFESLREQVRAGLSIACSGIPWWTTDIGGFWGGDVENSEFRELIIRWFQFAVFCPIFRLHGVRKPDTTKSGGPNEVWSFGEEAYEKIKDQLFLRERLRPYVMEQMKSATETGTPPMRPLWLEFPNDPAAWSIEDEFLLGADILVAPVLEYKARDRKVYLPAGSQWRDAWTGQTAEGGSVVTAAAPLERIPVYIREGRHIAAFAISTV